MTAPIDTRPHPPASPPQRPTALLAVGIVAVAVAAVLVTTLLERGPTHVPSVTVTNASALAIHVEVSPDGRGGWLGLGTVAPHAERRFEDVVDQGGRWVFRYSAGPHVADTVSVTRGHLIAAQWRVPVPERVVEQLVAQGAVQAPEPRTATIGGTGPVGQTSGQG